ncbi:ground-like domain-containing protein [Ditylenchus destructor]|uniref:Ground-like domain-containing protein n=1 Tax=Ditylenchus destructor TaxID=166010 RepID=A0AAD4MLS0_9BILA|nr:ground-like domain-containing protein [Ditylenchus destructor]
MNRLSKKSVQNKAKIHEQVKHPDKFSLLITRHQYRRNCGLIFHILPIFLLVSTIFLPICETQRNIDINQKSENSAKIREGRQSPLRFQPETGEELKSKLLDNLNRYSSSTYSAKGQLDALEPAAPEEQHNEFIGTNGGENDDQRESDLMRDYRQTPEKNSKSQEQQSMSLKIPNLFSGLFGALPTPIPPAYPIPSLTLPTLAPPVIFTPFSMPAPLSTVDTTTPASGASLPGVKNSPVIVKNLFAEPFTPIGPASLRLRHSEALPLKTVTRASSFLNNQNKDVDLNFIRTNNEKRKPGPRLSPLPIAQKIESRNVSPSLTAVPVFLNRSSNGQSEVVALGNWRKKMYKLMQEHKRERESGPYENFTDVTQEAYAPSSTAQTPTTSSSSPTSLAKRRLELLNKLVGNNANSSVLLVLLNDNNEDDKTANNNGAKDSSVTLEEYSKTNHNDPEIKLYGVESSASSPISLQTEVPPASAHNVESVQNEWQRTAPRQIHAGFVTQKHIHAPTAQTDQQPSSGSPQPALLNPLFVTLAPPPIPSVMPTYTRNQPELLSEYASSVQSSRPTQVQSIPGSTLSSSNNRPENYVKDLENLGDDYSDTLEGHGKANKVQGEHHEDYDLQQEETCRSLVKTCPNSVMKNSFLSDDLQGSGGDENTEMCNSRRLNALIKETIIAGDAEASKRAIQARTEAEYGGFYNVICGTGFYSYIAHTDEFCLATAFDVNCYVFSPVCNLRLGFGSGIARRHMEIRQRRTRLRDRAV